MSPDILVQLIPIVAILIGGLIVLIPIAGLTARFAVKPLIEAISLAREGQGASRELAVLEQRVALLEQQQQQLDSSVQRLAEKKEFDRQLEQGA